MKKTLFLFVLLFSGVVNAGILKFTGEAGAFFPTVSNVTLGDSSHVRSESVNMDGETNVYYDMSFEHPVPVIPNVRIQYLTTNGLLVRDNGSSNKFDLSQVDYILYYKLIEGSFWLDLDIGVSIREFVGSLRQSGQIVPNFLVVEVMNYASAFVTPPGTNLSFGGELKTSSGLSSSTIIDTTLKVKYQTPFLVSVEGGYRSVSLKVNGWSFSNNVKGDFKGAFIGACLNF